MGGDEFRAGRASTNPRAGKVADHASLDPGTAAFEWGAAILLQPSETDDGENVLQKGIWGQAGGQWKLQVDKGAGIPSCVVSGTAPGGNAKRVVVKASLGVADGAWHLVSCRRTASRVDVLIDGAVRGSAAMAAVMLSSSAAVTVGAKTTKPQDNDQFHGMLDDVFMRTL